MSCEDIAIPVDSPRQAEKLLLEIAEENPQADVPAEWLRDAALFDDVDFNPGAGTKSMSWRRWKTFNIRWFTNHICQRQIIYPVPYAEEPKLDPDWTKESPDGEIFAADLFTEGRELLDAGLEQLRGAVAEDDVMAARAQLEGAREILARLVPQEAADCAAEAESLLACGLEYLGDGDDDNAVLLFESASALMSELPSCLPPG